MHRDITKRQRAEMEIKQQNQIIEHMWEAVIITDPQGRIEEYNASASRILGLHDKRPANEACKQHLIQITDNVKKTGRHEEEYVIGDPASPDAIYMDCLAMPVIGRDGDVVRIVSVHRDVTDRIRRQKEQDERTIQKERSMRLESLGKIAGGIAHDFNNLLTPVLGYAHLARSAAEKESPVYHDIDRVIKGMEKARNLVRQILAFGQKLDSTRSIEVFDDLIATTLSLLKDSFPPSVEVLWTPGCADTRIQCNKTLIDQLFMNLCWNAVQAMHEGGTLSIKTDQKGDWAAIRSQFQLKGDDHVRLVISDTGPGIDAKTKNHIYEPFFTTKGSSKSHGLGLSVVHGVVKAHGGTILVHNIKPHGACFEIYLPATKDHNIAANQPEFSDKHQYRNNKETILIIDDEEDVRKILRRMLNDMGIKTLCAESGPRAIEIIKNNPNINLVITDYLMPEMSGEDFAKTFRLHNKSTPIVLLSAVIEPRTVREYRAWGVNALLQKPVVPEDLYEMICAQLDGENKA
ncbi:hypothetical protein JCM17846_06750 [Iodidimonas nitroreducens]|uniref:histidine kinase n=2 Tax=Iodidimonas nitroreducens TaxID=1236968 RepID=A0A5A7N3Z3_9PROT|nr:hypothetical protein JCM17846_06750 [Iodidimonas nitroreducens]